MVKQRKRTIILFLLPAFTLIILFVYVPILMNFYYALFQWSAFSATKQFVGTKNLIRLFADPTIRICIKNNLIYAVFSITFQVGLALVLAAVLEDKLFRGSQPFFRTVYFLPSLISVTVVGLLWQMIYSPVFGFLNPMLKAAGFNFEKPRYQFTYLHIDGIIKRQILFFENGGSFNENLLYQGL